jgi:peptidoglycan/xylan/chitin deacetylase (PgdA/CDA1 family)
LEVTPEFFERVIRRLRRSGADLVGMDEVHRRMRERDFPRRFVSITFDDGYRDTMQCAYPILKKYDVPFTVYVATSFADRIGELWWLALEAVIAQNELIGLRLDGRDRWFECGNVQDKRAVYDHIYWWLRQLKTEEELRTIVRELATRHRVDMAKFCARGIGEQPRRDRGGAWNPAGASGLSGRRPHFGRTPRVQDRGRTGL